MKGHADLIVSSPDWPHTVGASNQLAICEVDGIRFSLGRSSTDDGWDWYLPDGSRAGLTRFNHREAIRALAHNGARLATEWKARHSILTARACPNRSSG